MIERNARFATALVTIAAAISMTIGSAFAQQQPTPAPRILSSGPGTPDTYGTASNIIYNLGPENFGAVGGAWSNFILTGTRISTQINSGMLNVSAAIHLPNGAVVDSFDYFYFDSHPTFNPSAEFRMLDQFGVVTEVAPVNFFPNVASGNIAFHVDLQTPVQINNSTTRYSLFFRLNYDPTGIVQLYKVRVNYRLVVSPAPGTATFADVPVGHPFHRFVEALAAAGITGGCGGANYCPNDPLTRGQMAVFLAAALGLHWPN